MIAFTQAARARNRELRKAAIMDFLADHPDSNGADIWMSMHINSGVMSLLLRELEQGGSIASRWSDGPRPRRRLYHVTEEVES